MGSKKLGINQKEVHQKVVQKELSEEKSSSNFTNQFISSQIDNNQWYSFFKTMDRINSYNFNIIAWFRVCEQGRLECSDDKIIQKDFDKELTRKIVNSKDQ
jgi:hypothetical protein